MVIMFALYAVKVHTMQQMPTHRSLEKALEILLSFEPHNEEKGTLELGQSLGFHPSTVSRLLHVLQNYGFVQQNPDTKKFMLGHAVVDLASAVNESLNGNLTRMAIPFVEKLRDRLGDTVVLEVAAATGTMIAHIAEGPGPMRIRESVGGRHGYNAAAGAKSILAHGSEEFRERILKEELPRFTARTIRDPGVLRKHLGEIRQQGFAFDDEERNTGIRAFGCPVFNHDEKPIAAVAVAGPAHRITWDRRSEIVPALQETAAGISRQLFYRGEREQAGEEAFKQDSASKRTRFQGQKNMTRRTQA
jgi:DNA-binding IclR family transcriptional regulator